MIASLTVGKVIAFFLTGAGRYLLLAGAAAAFLYGVREAGYNAAMRECQAEKLNSQLNAAKADLQAARNASAHAREQIEQLDAEVNAERQRSKDYEEALAKRPAPGCTLTDDDLRRLWPQRKLR